MVILLKYFILRCDFHILSLYLKYIFLNLISREIQHIDNLI